nr:immunoglobulin heavy chain junction region [Macaca mulatta]
CANGVASLDVW